MIKLIFGLLLAAGLVTLVVLKPMVLALLFLVFVLVGIVGIAIKNPALALGALLGISLGS